MTATDSRKMAFVPSIGSRLMPNDGPGGIIVHAMGEFVMGQWAPHFLASLTPKLQAHAYVTPSGVLVKQQSVEYTAQHAYGYNDWLGVELLVPGNFDSLASLWATISRPDWLSQPQYWTLVHQLRVWVDFFGFGPDQLKRHADVDAAKQDPGAGFPWARLHSDVFDVVR
jgi:N-acetyl-anhydromuramyl-L-alanine amidase AmpD